MAEPTGPKTNNKVNAIESNSAATSKDQLSDLEEQETTVDAEDPSTDAGPSPDGELDGSDEIKDAGPV